jgi:hypothetical protein
MSQGLVERQNLEDIADAIRSKNGSSDTYTPSEMAQAISGIHTADEVVLVQKTVNANGQYNASDDSADGYSGVSVNVPNSYTATDEGKVVSGGALVGQTSKNVTANGTYNTTENNEVIVNVPTEGGGSSNPIPPDYQGKSYAYLVTNGGFYKSNSNECYMNFYRLNKDKTYAIFIGNNVSNRLRIQFYANKSYSDFEQYVLNANENTQIYTCDNNITGTQDLSGESLMRRFIFTPTTNGELIIMTSNSAGSGQYVAYCVEL